MVHSKHVYLSEETLFSNFDAAVNAFDITEDFASAIMDALNESHQKELSAPC